MELAVRRRVDRSAFVARIAGYRTDHGRPDRSQRAVRPTRRTDEQQPHLGLTETMHDQPDQGEDFYRGTALARSYDFVGVI